MARKKNQNSDVQAPEGFDINIGRERGEGWVHKEKGNTVQGELLGRFSFKDGRTGKQRSYNQIKLHEPCKISVTVEEGDEEITSVTEAKPGSLVNVDESAALTDVSKLIDGIERGGKALVWFQYKEKESIGGGQSFWPVHGPKAKWEVQPRKE